MNNTMKNRNLLSTFLIALCGGVVAIFVYAQIFESKGGPGSGSFFRSSSSFPYHLAGYEPHNISDVSFPDLTFAAEKAVNCVVHVRVKSMQNVNNPWLEYFYGRRQQIPREGFGSGVIISPDGYIITNNHVVSRAEEIEVALNNRRIYTAKLIGADPATDLALLKIEETDLPYLIFGDSEAMRVGEWVLAVGNPYNLTSTVTTGIVSAKARHLGISTTRSSRMEIESFIQTDAAVNQGNSGGALVNINGDLIGINTLIISQSGGFTGSSFAIPATIAQKVMNDLKDFGAVQRAFVGVTFYGGNDNFSNEKEELFVEIVDENLGAAEAGIKVGDVITSINDVSISTFAEFQEQISKYRPNDRVKITAIRDNKTQPFMVTLRNIEGTTHILRGTSEIYVFGATFEELTQRERQDLGIRAGVKVKDVGEGRLSSLQGIRNGFIITAVNDRAVNSARDVQNIVDSVEEGGRILINGVNARGQVSYFALRK